jgi:hypothetical protein
MVDRSGFEHLGPFRFDFSAYEQLLLSSSSSSAPRDHIDESRASHPR